MAFTLKIGDVMPFIQKHLIRVTLAVLVSIHGWSRWLNDAVTPFGTWLEQMGWPFGHVLAWSITAFEVVAMPLLALGLLIRPIVAVMFLIYSTGLLLVHWPAGWFVVGLGRNGMEYSVLILVCLVHIWSQSNGKHLILRR